MIILDHLSGEPYVNITSEQTLPEFTAQYIKHLRNKLHLKWDVFDLFNSFKYAK